MPLTDGFETVERTCRPLQTAGCSFERDISADPHMHGRMRTTTYHEPRTISEVLEGRIVGEGRRRIPRIRPGKRRPRTAELGRLRLGRWCKADHCWSNLAPISTGLGMLGVPGRTAYFGVLDVAVLGTGDTVVVSGTAGAVRVGRRVDSEN